MEIEMENREEQEKFVEASHTKNKTILFQPKQEKRITLCINASKL
jgi:hypothetical protein